MHSIDFPSVFDALAGAVLAELIEIGPTRFARASTPGENRRSLLVKGDRGEFEMFIWDSGDLEFGYGTAADNHLEHHVLKSEDDLRSFMERFLDIARSYPNVTSRMIPKTDRVGTYVGVCPTALEPDVLPSRANDCPIVMWPETGGEPFGLDRWDARNTLDLSSGMPDEARRQRLAAFAEAVASVFFSVQSVADLRRMSVEGRLVGVLRKDAREFLQDGG